MARSSGWRPRCAAVVLAASACLIGGITSAQAAPDPGQRLTAPAAPTSGRSAVVCTPLSPACTASAEPHRAPGYYGADAAIRCTR